MLLNESKLRSLADGVGERAAREWLGRVMESRARTPRAAVPPHIAALRAGPAVDRVEYLTTDHHGDTLTIDDTQRTWHTFIDVAHALGLHAGVMAPRGSGKTSQLVVGRAVDRIGREPNARLQIISVADPVSRKRVGAVKRIIERSERFRELYPDVRPDPEAWAKNEIFVQRNSGSPDPTLIAYGVNSASIGSRSDGSAFDDIDDKQSMSAAVRESRRDVLDSGAMPSLEVGALAMCACTAWHDEDYAHTKFRATDWAWLIHAVSDDCRWIEYVVIVAGKAAEWHLGGERCEPTGSGLKRIAAEIGLEVRRMPLYAHFDREVLLKRRGTNEKPTRAFRRAYQQDAYTNEEQWFPSFDARCVHFGNAVDEIPGWQHWQWVTGVDLSSKKRPGNAVVTAGLAPDGRHVIGDVRIGAWSGPDLLRELERVDAVFRPQTFVVESNAYQETFHDFAREKPEVASLVARIRDYQTPGNVHTDEFLGIKFLETEFENRAWLLMVPHERRAACDCGRCELLRQVNQHPHGKQKDALMALWFCREGFRLHQPTGAIVTNPNDPPRVHIQSRSERFHEYGARR